jgi:hypothetical protein
MIQVSALDYNPAVSVGDYVKYGNIIGVGPGLDAYNANDWFRYDVVSVNQTAVVLCSSGRFKNGTAIPGDNVFWSYDVFLGSVNGTTSLGGPIISGNLTVGDIVHSYTFDKINKTVTKTYLGYSRQVNILNFTQTVGGLTEELTYFYDRESGMLLEFNARNKEIGNNGTMIRTISYSVVETNLFETKAETSEQNPYIQYGILAGVVVLLAGLAYVYSKKKKNRPRDIHFTCFS